MLKTLRLGNTQVKDRRGRVNSSLPFSSLLTGISLCFLLIGFLCVLPKNVPSRENYRPVNSCVVLGTGRAPLARVKIMIFVNKLCVCVRERKRGFFYYYYDWLQSASCQKDRAEIKITELIPLPVTLVRTRSHFKTVPPIWEQGSQEQSVHELPFAAFLVLWIHSGGTILDG